MKVQIVGGLRDGELVDYVGFEMCEAIRPNHQRGLRSGSRLPTEQPEYRYYDLCSWSGDDGIVSPRYVLRDLVKGLGAK